MPVDSEILGSIPSQFRDFLHLWTGYDDVLLNIDLPVTEVA